MLSACAIGYSYNTNKILNEEYTNYYSFHTKGELFFATGLSVHTMVLDGFVFAAFISAPIVIIILKKTCCKSKIDEIWFCQFCAYSIIFPFCNLANHFHYIIIAFIHDVYHAIGVALVYGILIVVLCEALVQLPKVFENCKDSCIKCCTSIKNIQGNTRDDSNCETQAETPGSIEMLAEPCDSTNENDAGSETLDDTPLIQPAETRGSVQCCKTLAVPCDSIRNRKTAFKNICNCECNKRKKFGKDNDNENDAGSERQDDNRSMHSCHFICILVAKIIVIVILIGYFIYNILIYYYLPINKAFDDATNHLIGLYQAITVFFAAVAAYLIFNKEYTSSISVFTKAEYEHGVLKRNRCKNWKNFTAQKRDNIMAKELLELLKNMKPRLDNTQGDNPGGNPEE